MTCRFVDLLNGRFHCSIRFVTIPSSYKFEVIVMSVIYVDNILTTIIDLLQIICSISFVLLSFQSSAGSLSAGMGSRPRAFQVERFDVDGIDLHGLGLSRKHRASLRQAERLDAEVKDVSAHISIYFSTISQNLNLETLRFVC